MWASLPVIGESFEPPQLPLQSGDPAAVPVLVALLDDSDPAIRSLAVQGIAKIGPGAKDAVLPLVAYCERLQAEFRTPEGLDRDLRPYIRALETLRHIDRDAAVQVDQQLKPAGGSKL
jgi:hypothetical protein